MNAMTVEELIKHPDKLIEHAESGTLSVVTKDGHPIFFAVPCKGPLDVESIFATIAVRLYENEAVSLGRAAKISRLSISEFIDHLGALKIPAIRYSAEELERELAQFG